MLFRARAIGTFLLLCGAAWGVACSGSPYPGSTPAGEAGSSASGGSTSKAGASGKSGATSKGGGAGRAGASGKSGASGDNDPGGEGGEGGTVDPCAACASGACLPDGECVTCTPSKDVCPANQYCTKENQCVPGCKNDESCASGVCSANHDCQSCLGDQECSEGRTCGNNACSDPCTAAQEGGSVGCGTGLTCCSLHCVDALTDSKHCGACGAACGAGEFCGITGCEATTLSAVCSIAKAVVVLDGSNNEPPARAIANALQVQCNPAPGVREVSQTVADVVNTSNGRPVAGGDELLVATGGGFFAKLTDYVSQQPISPIYGTLNNANDNLEYRKRSDGSVVVSSPFHSTDAEKAGHDFFVIQFMRDPSSGSLILNAQGFWESGTNAASYYFENGLMPTLSTQVNTWYVYEWTDANADGKPALVEIEFKASGS